MFHRGIGLQQGCILSPLLFIVYMSWIDKSSQADVCHDWKLHNHVICYSLMIWFCSFYLPKQMEKDQLDDLELDRPITMRILDGITWGEVWWFNFELLPPPDNSHGKASNKEETVLCTGMN